MSTRLVAVPDTDGELVDVLERLEEVLGALQNPARDALWRLQDPVLAAERRAGPELVAADGRFELIPVRFAELEEEDLRIVGEAIAILGRSLLPAGDELTREVLEAFTEHRRKSPGELVAAFARAHGLLDLAPDDDTHALAARVAGATRRVVLTPEEEQVYRRLTARVLAMFHLNDPLARFLYRGT